MHGLVSDGSPAFAPLPGARIVRLGRRVDTTRWPSVIARLCGFARKLVWTIYEASLVQTPVRYAWRELATDEVGDYALRRSSGRFSIRHRTGDVDILRKFYGYRYYEWPAEVKLALGDLGRPVNVLDLGANIGLFDVHARAQAAIGHVVCFEPDPANARVLKRARDANQCDWEVVPACASNRAGIVRFGSGHQNLSRITSDGDRDVPAVDVFGYLAGADLVKMNIEGSEWEILADPRMADAAPAWIVEYHRIRNPPGDITRLATEAFERLGYRVRVVVSHDDNGLLWAWKST